MIRQSLFAAILAFLGGCTTLTEYHETKTPTWVAERTTVEHDAFKKMDTIRSPKVKGTMGSGYNGEYYHAFLRGWRSSRGNGQNFQIYVATSHIGRWHHYRSTWDEHGDQLPTTRIGSDVGCSGSTCTYYEDVGVSVERSYLESHRASGIRFKVEGTGGEVVVRIPGGYVDGFLRRFDGSPDRHASN